MSAFFKKLRNLPNERKKIIIWIILGISALILLLLWGLFVKRVAQTAHQETILKQIGIPELRERMKEMNLEASFEMPGGVKKLKEKIEDLSPEELERLEKADNLEELETILEEIEKNQNKQKTK